LDGSRSEPIDRCDQRQRRQRLGRERWGIADGLDLQNSGGQDQTAPAGQRIGCNQQQVASQPLPLERQDRGALTVLTSDAGSTKETSREIPRLCADGGATRKSVGEAIELQTIGGLARADTDQLNRVISEIQVLIRKELSAIVDQ
jgi:hypothetical protein